MDNTSVSKGVFVKKAPKGERKRKYESPNYADSPRNIAFREIWEAVETAAEDFNKHMYEKMLDNLRKYVKTAKKQTNSTEISTAVLLIGINLPDHEDLFEHVAKTLQPFVASSARVWARDCNTLKDMLEETVLQLITNPNQRSPGSIRKPQCTMRALVSWKEENYSTDSIFAVVLPDFESFSPKVLQDFILVLSSYLKSIKIVLVFGVATTLHILHMSLSYNVSSKLLVQVFDTPTQKESLPEVLDNTVFSPNIPFRLTGRAFKLLTDIFLYYSYSVANFMEGYKVCMLQHFSKHDTSILCCKKEEIKEKIMQLSKEQLEVFKLLPSIEKVISKTQQDDRQFKAQLESILNDYHDYMDKFFEVLNCLKVLSFFEELKCPMGKTVREIYQLAVSSDIVTLDSYKEVMTLLRLMSKEEFIEKAQNAFNIAGSEQFPDFYEQFVNYVQRLQSADTQVVETPDRVQFHSPASRTDFRQTLKTHARTQSMSPFKKIQTEFLEFLDKEFFAKYLKCPYHMPGHEIFCFSDADAVRRAIRGSLRSTIYTALNNPGAYLPCDCCQSTGEDLISPTLPDLSVVYKLHLESRKLINMYDWLQAFATIIDPQGEDKEERQEVNPHIQARFTRAVATLEFLGFIKASKKKLDHVKRLT